MRLGATSPDDLLNRLRGLTGPGARGGGRPPRGAVPSFAMTDLLARGRGARPAVPALDAVMGEDWAIVEAGRAGRAPVVRAGIAVAHRRDVARHPGGGLPGRKPQAVVKMVRRGGASDLRGMRAQMAYLSRRGAEPLQRSERYMGVEIDPEQASLMEAAWRMPAEGRDGGADRTTHFIVSFPEGTEIGAAERAGRDWAEALFGSGRYGGDSFDYYTAFHTDRAHPHLHVVVHRRGLETGAWLKVSLRGDLHYDRMRAVLVEVAGREGIELEATPRLARGVHDRPIPDAEYRRAGVARRAPVALEHSPETALRAAAGLIHHARGAAAAAREIEPSDPAQAERLRAAGVSLGEGRALTPGLWGLPEALERTGEAEGLRAASEPRDERDRFDRSDRFEQSADAARESPRVDSRLDEVTKEVLGKFAVLEAEMEDVDDPATRMGFLRQVAAMKADSVTLMRNPPDALRPFGGARCVRSVRGHLAVRSRVVPDRGGGRWAGPADRIRARGGPGGDRGAVCRPRAVRGPRPAVRGRRGDRARPVAVPLGGGSGERRRARGRPRPDARLASQGLSRGPRDDPRGPGRA